jgi:hypothetical protein
MTLNKIVSHLVAAVAAGFLAYLIATQVQVKRAAAGQAQIAAQQSASAEKLVALEQQLQAAELARDQYKSFASEVHKLRSEISELRKENHALQQSASRTPAAETKKETQTEHTAELSGIPDSFPTHGALAQFAGNLRLKAKSGLLTREEQDWLQSIKPDLENLEAAPQAFAEFQSAMIQSVVGITDPAKTEQIRQTIQRVYEAANTRGLNLQARPAEDAAWVEQRHQLDRRGTGAVQNILDQSERALFDNAFLGIMGVDLGTGVDQSLYPPGFIQGERLNR